MIIRKRVFIIILFLFILSVIGSSGPLMPSARAQYWAALPPYNLLWPLWSPPLVTDFNPDPLVLLGTTPIVTELSNSTILPVQPALVWDPTHYAPWAVYNIPLAFGGGLAYFDKFYGLNVWPPSNLLDPITGAPAPIALPLTWSLLTPTDLGHFEYFIPLANATFGFTYNLPQAAFLSLLTSADIWGLPPILPF